MDQSGRNHAPPPGGQGAGWLIGIGVVSILLGAVALVFPWWASLGIELAVGIFLVVVGALELVRVFSNRPESGSGWNVLFGLLAVAAGLLLLFYPLQGVITLTLVLTFFFLIGGTLKTVSAFYVKPAPGWGWMLASGLVSLVLGVIVLIALPGSAFWIFGILFGIDLIFFGAAQTAFGLGLRRLQAIDVERF
ncbi:MAG: HdeD family acid-resistance protein [Wenzhouxiangellaceae bacterium]|nr:HdeD family acid-resistance protein [Wenzhouxiangellaceae bacterium]